MNENIEHFEHNINRFDLKKNLNVFFLDQVSSLH